jgi:hypothetical protein
MGVTSTSEQELLAHKMEVLGAGFLEKGTSVLGFEERIGVSQGSTQPWPHL